MDGHTGDFENQFRRMVVSNGTSPTHGNDGAPPSHPTVRLPPASSYPAPQQQQTGLGFPRQHQNGYMHSPPPQSGQQPHAQVPHYRMTSHSMQQNRQFQPSRGNHFAQPHGFQQDRGGFYGSPPQRMNSGPPGQRARRQQEVALDPNAFQRRGYAQPRGRGGQHHLFNPHQPQAPPMFSYNDQQKRKVDYLQAIASSEVNSVQMSQKERDEKNAFRQALQQVCNDVCDADRARLPHVSLECFGSFKSGFATAGSDMDLVIVVKDQSSTSASLSLLEDDLPRALERMLLKLGFGARLLTRTRVPIIKVCEKPDSSLLPKLRAEREKWDLLPNELKYPHLHQDGDDDAGEGVAEAIGGLQPGTTSNTNGDAPADKNNASSPAESQPKSQQNGTSVPVTSTSPAGGPQTEATQQPQPQPTTNGEPTKTGNSRPKREDRPWIRERRAGPLDFPKSGVGIQSDINFFNPLGLHNTQLLYCYSLCDDRVQPMVLFVKAWAKRRKINSSYSGTLSSYGFVLMVLHYLVNVASPPVIPNLQSPSPPGKNAPPEPGVEVDGWHVNFWRNDNEILSAKQRGHLTLNREPLGSLLAGFFQYYSSQGGAPQFVWTQQTLSLRTQGGILTKDEKGWTKAVTEEGEGKKIQHRFLFCIEDPFELNHNVARTVTHNGIVAIRDEFRRARRILMTVGRGEVPAMDGQLFDELLEPEEVVSIAADTKADGWQPDLDGAADKPVSPAPAKPTPNNTRGPNATRKKSAQTPTPPKASALNVTDNDAFPTLGAASSKSAASSKKRSPHKRVPSEGEYSEITGDKAKAVLDEVKRKKDEAQAESTAMGAAEAVLGDEW